MIGLMSFTEGDALDRACNVLANGLAISNGVRLGKYGGTDLDSCVEAGDRIWGVHKSLFEKLYHEQTGTLPILAQESDDFLSPTSEEPDLTFEKTFGED